MSGMASRRAVFIATVALGWTAVLIAGAVAPAMDTFVIVFVAVCAACTFLLWRHDFPKREEGIVLSWLGPALLVAAY